VQTVALLLVRSLIGVVIVALRPTGRAEFTAAAASTYHFVELLAYPDRLELRAVTPDGQVFDRFTHMK
jgi:hypothetical protein